MNFKLFKFNALLALLLVLCGSTHLSAAEQNIKLSIDTKKEIPLEEFFRQVETVSDYLFQYKDQDIAGKSVHVALKDVTVQQLMDKALKGTGLTYSVRQRYVVIEKLKQEVKSPVQPQKKTVTGTVLDQSGQPLPGVFVIEKGSSSNGATTDLDGKYSIVIMDQGEAGLVFSCLGFQTQTVDVASGEENVDITLADDSTLLEEVVVVGYGVQKKVNLTGSVATASGEVLENRPIANVAQGLQGVIPNLNISFNSGQPDAAAKVNIRGNTSLNGGSALILLDGVEISDISMVNPQDIENISVLKDASAAAVYGARAAFGVMLITTKKGSADKKPQINYNTNLSWNTPARIRKSSMPDSYTWATMWNQAYENNGEQPWFNDTYMSYLKAYVDDPVNNPGILVDYEQIQDSRHQGETTSWAYVSNTDWIREFYKDAGFMQQHNASITGGGKHSRYYASLGFKDQDGVFRYGNDNYKRVNATVSLDIDLSKWLNVGVSARMNYRKKNLPHVNALLGPNIYYEIYRMFPTMAIFLPNGEWAGLETHHMNYNFLGRMEKSGREIDEAWDNWYTLRFDIHPIKGLSIKGDYSYNTFFRKDKVHNKTYRQVYPEGGGADGTLIGNMNGVTNLHDNNNYQVLNIWAEYKHSFNHMHNLSAMLGYNQEEKKFYSNSLTMIKLLDNNLPATDMAQEYKKNSEVNTMWRVQGTFFRLNYDYDSRYLVELNGRYDGSSKYAKKDRWAFFPSASLGWNIAREPFMEKAANVVSDLKLRYSMGMLGNQVTEGYHDYMSIIQTLPLGDYAFDNKLQDGLSTPSIPSLVTWEKVITYDLGLDWSFWQNRLTGSFDWYIRDTKGMVRPVTLPATFGTSTGKENVADMRTIGWEFSINWRDRVDNVAGRPFDYGVGLGLSDYQATITKYDNPTGALKDLYEGMKMGEIWGYTTRGFIKDQNEADLMTESQQYFGSKWYPGDIRYQDLDDDGYITPGANTLDNPGDRRIIGNSTPRYRFNFNANMSWYGFTLDIGFEGVAKRDLWVNDDLFWGFSRSIYNSAVMKWHVDKVWSENNPDAYFPRISSDGNLKSKQCQTKYLQNAAYLRLKNLTLSYDLPQKWMDAIKISKARIYVSGMNLWEITGLPPFMMPDIADKVTSSEEAEGGGSLSGKDYAFMRSWSLGLNITF